MNYSPFCILLIVAISGYSQTIFESRVLQQMGEGHIPFEKVFVHTNKEKYLSEDTIWFQTFVGDADNRPSLATTRLHVNLLNHKGEIVSSKNTFIENGTGTGQFEGMDLPSGIYYIQAYTQNMRNFGTDGFYLQELEIGLARKAPVQIEGGQYFVDIFPEGGCFVENVMGTGTVKVVRDGLGSVFSAKIVNGEDQVLQRFSSTHSGMARFDLNYESGEQYTAVLKFKDTVIERRLPGPKKEGIVINVDNSNEKFLTIHLKTNEKTLRSPFNGDFSLLVHQRYNIGAYVPFKKMDSLSAVIVLNKAKLSAGVNNITLFQQERPIAQRSFFVEKRDGKIDIDLQKISPGIDSLHYRIKLISNGEPVLATLSVAVLPKSPQNLSRHQTIESEFLLSPYLNYHLENPAYYSDGEYKNRSEHLDLALLWQQASVNSKELFMEYNNPEKEFEPEMGFSISGEIAPPFLSNRFAIISEEGELVDQVLLNGSNRFSFDRLLLFKGDTLRFTFIEGFEFLKPNGVSIDSIETDFPKQPLPSTSMILDQKLVSNTTDTNGFVQGGTTLDEVLVTGKKRSDAYLRRKLLQEKYKPIVWDIGMYYEIPIAENLSSFNNNLQSFLQYYENVMLIHTDAGENYLRVNIDKEASLYIDGKYIDSIELGGISSLAMNDVETVMCKPLGKGYRQYQIFTTDNHQKGIEEQFSKYKSIAGYDLPQKYRTPISNSTLEDGIDLHEIDWKTSIRTNTSGEAMIKISKSRINEEIIFQIQGFAQDGRLISEFIRLN